MSVTISTDYFTKLTALAADGKKYRELMKDIECLTKQQMSSDTSTCMGETPNPAGSGRNRLVEEEETIVPTSQWTAQNTLLTDWFTNWLKELRSAQKSSCAIDVTIDGAATLITLKKEHTKKT